MTIQNQTLFFWTGQFLSQFGIWAHHRSVYQSSVKHCKIMKLFSKQKTTLYQLQLINQTKMDYPILNQSQYMLTPQPDRYTTPQVGSHTCTPAQTQTQSRRMRPQRLSFPDTSTTGRRVGCCTQRMPYELAPKNKPLHNDCSSTRLRRPSGAMSSLKSELATLKEEIGRLMEVDAEYSDKHERSTAEITLYRRESLGFSESNPELERTLKIQNQGLRLEIQKMQARETFQRDEHTQKVFELRQRIADLQATLDSGDHQINSLKQQLASANDKERDYRNNLQELQNISQRAFRQSKDKQDQLRRLSDEMQRVMQVINLREEQDARKSEEIHRLNSDLHEKDVLINQLTQKLNRPSTSTTDQQLQRVQQLLRAKDQQLAQYSATNKQCNQLRQQVVYLRGLLQASSDELQRTKQQLQVSNNHINQLQLVKQQQLSHLNKRLEQTTKNCDYRVHCLEGELNTIQELFQNKEKELQDIINRKQEELLHSYSASEVNSQIQHQLQALRNKSQFDEQEIERLCQLLQGKDRQLDEQTQQHKKELQSIETDRLSIEQLQKQIAIARQFLEKQEKESANRAAEKQHQYAEYSRTIEQEINTMHGLVGLLKDELAVSNAQISEQQKVIEHQQNQIDAIAKTEQIHEFEQELRAELDQLHRQLQQKQLQLTVLEQTSNSTQNQLSCTMESLTQKLSSTTCSLHQATHTLSITQQQLSQANCTIQYLQDQMDILNSSKAQTVKLAEELAKEQHEGHLKEAEVSSLRQQLEKVQQQLQEGREKWDQKVRDREHGQREEADIIDRLRAQVATLEKGIAELQNKCWEGQRYCQQLQHQLSQSQTQLCSSTNKVQTLSLQLSSCQSSCRGLQQKLSQLQSTQDLTHSRIISSQQQTIKQLENKVNSLSEHTQNANKELANSRARCQDHTRIIQERERMLRAKEEEISAIEVGYQRQIRELRDQIQRWAKAERHSDPTKTIQALQQKLRQQEKDYDDIVENLKKQLRNRSMQDLSMSRSGLSDLATIDSALKGQNDELNILRSQLKKRTVEAQSLKDTLLNTRTQLTNLKSLYEIQRAKSLSEKNSSNTAKQTQIQSLKYDLNLERKNSESIAQKIKYLAEENRKKDMFLQNYLVGKKAEKEDIKEFFGKYEAEFPIGQIKSNMMRELKEIERLENRIKELEKKQEN